MRPIGNCGPVRLISTPTPSFHEVEPLVRFPRGRRDSVVEAAPLKSPHVGVERLPRSRESVVEWPTGCRAPGHGGAGRVPCLNFTTCCMAGTETPATRKRLNFCLGGDSSVAVNVDRSGSVARQFTFERADKPQSRTKHPARTRGEIATHPLTIGGVPPKGVHGERPCCALQNFNLLGRFPADRGELGAGRTLSASV